ncbi:UNVERIFIED_CONTAM: hypothetical protein RMT77_012653 [Armadillidium vulgare]
MRCCNPLKKTKHSKTLRSVTDNIINLFPSLTKSSKVCDSCRLKIENQNVNPNDYTEIISNLKETCNNQNLTSSEKKLILSILPQSWGQEKKASFLGVSRKFVRKIIAKDNSKLKTALILGQKRGVILFPIKLNIKFKSFIIVLKTAKKCRE